MYPAVSAAFADFTTKFEGRVFFMYLDVLGLVTIGCGNLIDPIGAALALPFELKTSPGTVVSQADVTAEWNYVKSRTDMKLKGGGSFGAITKLQITEDTLTKLMASKLTSFEGTLKGRFAQYDQWPADAQLGLMSMAWAMGPAFSDKWPKFTDACNAADWVAAAADCKMNDVGNPGLRPRNTANEILFRNAAQVVAQGLAPDTLYYPRDLCTEAAGNVA
jgi:GH24 family phage-related lysozyme (muramidase)